MGKKNEGNWSCRNCGNTDEYRSDMETKKDVRVKKGFVRIRHRRKCLRCGKYNVAGLGHTSDEFLKKPVKRRVVK